MPSTPLFASSIALASLVPIGAAHVGNDANDANENSTGDSLPVVYTVPLVGQMGTDINAELLEDIIEDVQEVQPDLLVFRLKAADIGTNRYIPTYDWKEAGKFEIAEYRAMVQDINTKLGHIDKVIWVEDSVGLSSLLPVSFERIYMSEDARLYGLQNLHRMTQNWSDEDIREKMEAATVGKGRGFFESGGRGKYARVLGDAMIDPEALLSANFVGREVIWLPNLDGIWTVDDSTEQVANFTATTAMDTMFIEDTVGSLEDLVFVLGYREYDHNTQGDEIAEKYTERWRATYERCKNTYEDFQTDRGLGTTTDPVRILLAKRKMLEEVVKAMKKYSAVERRMSDEYGVSINSLEFQIDSIKDQIRQMKDSQRGGRIRGGSRGGTRLGG